MYCTSFQYCMIYAFLQDCAITFQYTVHEYVTFALLFRDNVKEILYNGTLFQYKISNTANNCLLVVTNKVAPCDFGLVIAFFSWSHNSKPLLRNVHTKRDIISLQYRHFKALLQESL